MFNLICYKQHVVNAAKRRSCTTKYNSHHLYLSWRIACTPLLHEIIYTLFVCVRDETEGADGRQEDSMSCVTSEVMVESRWNNILTVWTPYIRKRNRGRQGRRRRDDTGEMTTGTIIHKTGNDGVFTVRPSFSSLSSQVALSTLL